MIKLWLCQVLVMQMCSHWISLGQWKDCESGLCFVKHLMAMLTCCFVFVKVAAVYFIAQVIQQMRSAVLFEASVGIEKIFLPKTKVLLSVQTAFRSQ